MHTCTWITILLAGGALAVAACSTEKATDDDDDGQGGQTTTTTTPTYTTTSTGTGTATGTGTNTGTGTGQGCYYGEDLPALPGSTVETEQDLCTQAQIDGFWTACWTEGSTTEDCTAFDTANTACVDCIIHTNDTGPIPVLEIIDGGDVTYLMFNKWACDAIERDLPQCAYPIEAWVFCSDMACFACDDQTSWEACLDVASNEGGACADLWAAIPEACAPVLQASDWMPACECTTGDQGADCYATLAPYYCGPAAG